MSKSLCNQCPDGIRGLCCHISIPVEDMNIILDHVACPYLHKETKRCTIYKDRKKKAPWCLHEGNMFGKGGLPEGCIYLKEYPELEKNPKKKIKALIDEGKINQEIVGLYNFYNNMNFEFYEEFLIKG